MVMSSNKTDEAGPNETSYLCGNGHIRHVPRFDDTNPLSKSSPFSSQRNLKETRQLLLDNNNQNNKKYTGVLEEGRKYSRMEGVKDLLDNKNYAKNAASKCSLVSSASVGRSRRLVTKEGLVDIKYKNVPGSSKRLVTDLFHTLIDAKWRYIILLFTASFIISWIFFGTFWYVIVKYDETHRICIDNVDNWVNGFLFSIEVQTTIGFGGRAVTSRCPEGVLLLVIQTIVGMFINCAMLGLLFAKLSRPKNRGKTTLFSKFAVVALREEKLCLMFRYVDFRPRRLLDSNIRVCMVRQKMTKEGEFIPLDMADLKITIDHNQVDYQLRLFPLFPLTLIHEIDDESPLYDKSRFEVENDEYEIIPILEGTVPTTGSTTQALTSYKPNEILWGHRFKPVFSGLHIGHAVNRIDLSPLHDTEEIPNFPDFSAEELDNGEVEDDEDKTDGESFAGSNGYESASASQDSINQSRLNMSQHLVTTRSSSDHIQIDMENISHLKESDA